MPEDDEQKTCPFMSRPITDTTGAGVSLPVIFVVPCIEGRCRAWAPAVNTPRKVGKDGTVMIDGHYVAPGWCMLIPASEPDPKFIPEVNPLVLLEE